MRENLKVLFNIFKRIVRRAPELNKKQRPLCLVWLLQQQRVKPLKYLKNSSSRGPEGIHEDNQGRNGSACTAIEIKVPQLVDYSETA